MGATGYDTAARTWAPAVQRFPQSCLYLPDASAVENWHLTDLSSGLVGRVLGTSFTAAATHVTEMAHPRFSLATGLHFNGNGYLFAPAVAALQLTGDMTLEMILSQYAPNGSNGDGRSTYFLCGASGETPETNILYHLSSGNSFGSGLQYFHEYGSGSNDGASTYNSPNSVPLGRVFHLALRREGNQVSIYVDKALLGQSAVLAEAPTGGSSSFLQIAGFSTNSVNARVTVYSVRVTDSGDESVAFGGYDATLGQVYPLP